MSDVDLSQSVVRYRIGLNPIQEQICSTVRALSGVAVQGVLETLYTAFPDLKPVYPIPSTADAFLSNEGDALFHPNDLVTHIGLHEDTIDKYLLNFIGLPRNSPEAKKLRMTFAHPDAPWGADYAKYLSDPLPLRLVSARALIFILTAPTSIYRPTTNDPELIARWSRLVDFRNRAPALFGIPKGSSMRVKETDSVVTCTRRKPKTTSSEEPVAIPTLFTLSLPSVDEVDQAVREITVEPTPAPVKVEPPPESAVPADMEGYFKELQVLRETTDKYRSLLDILPRDEVDERVLSFFRLGLKALDKRFAR